MPLDPRGYWPRSDKRRLWPATIYLVADDHGHCKVGVSRELRKRLNSLQAGYPYKLRLSSTWDFDTEDEARGFEAYVLERCPRHRLNGEWLRGDDWPVRCWITKLLVRWRDQKIWVPRER